MISIRAYLMSQLRVEPHSLARAMGEPSRAEFALCEVAGARNDPIKLHRLLDVFDSLNKLRLDFKLFGSKACAEIQSQTGDLVKLLIDGAVEIIEEFIVQVELQWHMPPPS